MSVKRIHEGPSVLAIVGWTVFVVLVTYGLTVAYIAPEQRENLASLTPTAQESIEAERQKRWALEHLLATRDSALDACQLDRSILQAEMGVHLPQVTVRKESR